MLSVSNLNALSLTLDRKDFQLLSFLNVMFCSFMSQYTSLIHFELIFVEGVKV